jgi:hypothetical protein
MDAQVLKENIPEDLKGKKLRPLGRSLREVLEKGLRDTANH